MIRSLLYKFLYFSLIFCSFHQAVLQAVTESYDLQIEGVTDSNLLKSLHASSQLIHLDKYTPDTPAALQRRAEADIPHFLKVLHSFAYYNAKIALKVEQTQTPPSVRFTVDLGPVYPIEGFVVLATEGTGEPFPYAEIPLNALDISIGEPALPEKILNAEEGLLDYMMYQGYPLAKIIRRDVVADQRKKSVFITLHLDSGPSAKFGQTVISGNQSVNSDFIENKIAWKKGKAFTPDKVALTQEALEASGLFSSISINYPEATSEGNELPMEIQLTESKHRSIGGGLSYATQRGPGGTFEWENRNMRGMGERLKFKTQYWKDTQEMRLLYVKPDFLRINQDLVWSADIEHEKTEGFTDTSVSLSGSIERQVNERTRLSYGVMVKNLHTSKSDNNRDFTLLKTPFHLRWVDVDDPVDPSYGATLNLKAIPSVQFLRPQFAYCINTVTATGYYPLAENRLILAAKVTAGSILGATRHAIPPSERFYAGTENTLRGYRYMTVSPLGIDNKPIGGRSMLIGSFEARWRATEELGFVGFYEVGNVYSSTFPELDQRQLQSVGAGVRYNTPVGPLRFDVAVPLDKRRHIDSGVQFYFSIGHTF